MELKEIVDRIAASGGIIAEVAGLARDACSSQAAILQDAVEDAAKATAFVRDIPGLIKVYHHAANKAWHEVRIAESADRVVEFLQSAASRLESAVTVLATEKIGFSVDPPPHGNISFAPDTGLFYYRRDQADKEPLKVRFSARIGGAPITQVVTVSPLPAGNCGRHRRSAHRTGSLRDAARDPICQQQQEEARLHGPGPDRGPGAAHRIIRKHPGERSRRTGAGPGQEQGRLTRPVDLRPLRGVRARCVRRCERAAG
jgi:hypothetical protein